MAKERKRKPKSFKAEKTKKRIKSCDDEWIVKSNISIQKSLEELCAHSIPMETVATLPNCCCSKKRKDSPLTIEEMLGEHGYELLEFVEKGGTSHVYKVANKYKVIKAAKVIDLTKLSPGVRDYFLPNELKIMKAVSHSYIVSSEEVLHFPNHRIIITELATNDLIRMMVSIRKAHGKPELRQARIWFAQIVHAVVYLHSQGKSEIIRPSLIYRPGLIGIAHRDIKADNVLLFGETAKLSDFGFAEYSLNKDGDVAMCENFVGTPVYSAPETLRMSTAFDPFIADCFSLGVLLFTLVTFEFPFGYGPRSDSPSGLMALHRYIQQKRFKNIRPEIRADRKLMSLLRQLLNPDTLERISAKQALAHQWLEEVANKFAPIYQSNINRSIFTNNASNSAFNLNNHPNLSNDQNC